MLYVAATTQVVSAVMVVERSEEGHALKVQRPVYFISEVLSDSKTRYLQILKILYAVVMAKRKLYHYFDSHPITVVSSFPLADGVQSHDAAGKVAKWAMELMGREISYVPATAIKSRVLADFVAEWTEVQMPPAPVDQEFWIMHFDGSLTRRGAGVGLVFTSP